MTTTTYTPQAGSLASQVCGYLQNNLHDPLTLDDITDMFGGVRGNVHTLMAKSVEAKLLTRDRNADGEYIYQPGPALPKAGVDIDAIHTKRPKRQVATPTDVGALEIRDDPLPASRCMAPNKYHAAFATLRHGQCVRCESGAVGRVSGALRKFIEVKQITGQIKSVKSYPGDELFGRVWLLDAKVV
jgi:hypothetical protein